MAAKLLQVPKALSNIGTNTLPPFILSPFLPLSLSLCLRLSLSLSLSLSPPLPPSLPPSLSSHLLSERDEKYSRWKDAVDRCLHWEGGAEDHKHRERKINGKSKSANAVLYA